MLLVLALPGAAPAARLLVLGDSLSAAYGIDAADGWVSLLQRDLGERYEVVNASVSGETTAGGRSRLPFLLAQHEPDLVIIELGGNDGLRGHPVATIEANIDAMIETGLASGARVLLLGIRIPPNYGARYTESFFALYQRVAERHDVPLVPFLLDGIATVDALMQNDGIHPNRDGQPLILANVLPVLQPLLESIGSSAETAVISR